MNERFTAAELRARFPNHPESFIRRNAFDTVPERADGSVGNRRSNPKLERDPGHGALGQGQIQNFSPGKLLVRLTSYRTRLLDEDNLCEKYLVDCCRYSGLIRQDSPGAAKIEVRQEKVGKGEPEFVKIEIFEACR